MAFISVDRLEVNGMAHDMIFTGNAIAAMARLASSALPTLLRLTIGDHFRREAAFIHQPPDAQAGLIAQRNL